MPYFRVVLRTRAGATLTEGNNLKVVYQSEEGAIDLLFRTRRKDRGFGIPMALDLTIEVSGKASSLDEAMGGFSAAAQGASNILALGANAIVEQPPVVELAYDVTSEYEEHDFFQRRHPEPPFEILQGRPIHPSLLVPLFNCFARHLDADRLYQAAAHYNTALSHWQPGSELLALNHIWIAVETLSPAFLKRELEIRGIDDESLYKEWSLPTERLRRDRMNRLIAEIRSRIIFEGDQQCYRTAKNASDGFEHGFLTLKRARDLAAKVRDDSAVKLRRAIFDLADIDRSTRRTLLESPFDRPLERWSLDFQIHGKLVGSADHLAPSEGEHPHFEWREGDISATRLKDGNVRFKFDGDSLTARFGDGVTCKVKNVQVFAPRRDDPPLS